MTGKRVTAGSRLATVVSLLASLLVFGISAAWGGPPFLTDDPEPVEYRHGEVYLASQYANDKDRDVGTVQSGTAPHLEVNYGLVPDVQLHLIVPLAYNHPKGDVINYGIGDMEFGVKYRFVHETDMLPQVATFPLAEIPTGNSDRGLGGGHVPVYLPLWLQKSWGPWTTYGGGGYWINPGAGNKNYWFAGWEVQREFGAMLTLGAELFHTTKKVEDGRDRTGFNAGGFINLSDEHHILFSAGRDIDGDNRFSAYLAYQWTFGPEEHKKGKDEL